MFKGDPDLYGVIGHPIGHSLSPRIHATFAEQCQQSLVYRAIDAQPEMFETELATFQSRGGLGLNVTVPFKQAAWAWVEELNETARLAGAINTICFDRDGTTRGYNTDGIGLCTDLTQNLGYSLAGKDLLILGAGGASRGIIQPLMQQNPNSLTIANRTLDRGSRLAETFSHLGRISAAQLDRIPGDYDLVINATSASLSGASLELRAGLIRPRGAAYEMMYGQLSPFLRWAEQAGASLITDGLGMLVEQAAESFHIWRGIRPQTAPVLTALRQVVESSEKR
ncbi:MAG: shikimate dehydrogenase [Gammaproteobacteria bacterium]|nr:shikimate dehydrogenase [Gammaproteobacteria bacterium]